MSTLLWTITGDVEYTRPAIILLDMYRVELNEGNLPCRACCFYVEVPGCRYRSCFSGEAAGCYCYRCFC